MLTKKNARLHSIFSDTTRGAHLLMKGELLGIRHSMYLSERYDD